jgi:hypothetical protein
MLGYATLPERLGPANGHRPGQMFGVAPNGP